MVEGVPPTSTSGQSSSEIDRYNDDVESQIETDASSKKRKNINGRNRLSLRVPKSDVDDGSISTATRPTKSLPKSSSSNISIVAASHHIRVLLRKIATVILADLDDEALQRDGTETILIAITLLKEAIMGTMMAFVLVSLVLFVDHIFGLRMPTARHFRRATFSLMNDEETLRDFEVTTGLKLVSQGEYESMLEEISMAANKTKEAQSYIDSKSMDLIRRGFYLDLNEVTAEIEESKRNMTSWKHELKLDRFDDAGLFRGFKTHSCQWRVDWLQAKDNLTRYEAIIETTKKDRCVKSERQLEMDERRKNMLEDVGSILKNWDAAQKNFNPTGKWSSDESCSDRAEFLTDKLGYSATKAMSLTMVETNRCVKDSVEAKVDDEVHPFDPFCAGCFWGYENESQDIPGIAAAGDKLTCTQRGMHLMRLDGISMEEARLNVMMNETRCIINIPGPRL